MSVVICAIIGSTVSALVFPRVTPRICLNLCAANVSMPATHRNCIACAVNRTMSRNFIFAVTNVKIGSMADAWAFYRVKPISLMSIFARIANAIIP